MVTALLTCSVPALIGAIFFSAIIGVFAGQIATETAAWSE
jgi:hypothetical protein